VTGALAGVAGRLRVRAALRVTAAAIALGAVGWTVLVAAGLSAISSGVVVIAVATSIALTALVRRKTRWSHAAAAGAIERAYPDSRNVVITAEELLRHPERTRSWILERVLGRAATIATRLDRSTVVPLQKDVSWAVVGAIVAAAALVGLPHRALTPAPTSIAGDGGAVRRGTDVEPTVVATITPPAYISEPPRTLRNPDRIEAVQGSRLRLAIGGDGPWRARLGTEPLTLRIDGDLATADVMLERSGYVAVERGDGDTSARRWLVPIAIAPDRVPSIRIGAPAKDLLLPDAKPTIQVEASATDDFALRSLELRYTKVSGTGEQFEFHEGAIPLKIAQESDRHWNAHAQLVLPQLGLAPGDSIIYRVLGRDRRPGDEGLASSDTYFVEIAGPGQVALEGFEMPPDRERYALSQQMIVLKLERLNARERSLDRATLETEIGTIAAEQRAVRANFIFLTGGHVEDEEEEAEQSHEIQEGRLENTARREIAAAIQHMTRAEQGMAAINTTAALPPARAAVDALQRAFGRNRYFLRTVPVRSRVDPSRRLTGETSTAADWRRELFPARFDGPQTAARAIVSRLLELSPEIRAGSLPPAALTAFAEEAIAVDPASAEWQAISRHLLQLRDAKDDGGARAKMLSTTVTSIVAIVQRSAPPVRGAPRVDALRSAWAEERRR
jgi:hypothetical protein